MIEVWGLLVLAQCVLSLDRVREWLKFMRSASRPVPVEQQTYPPVSLIVPCRGNEPGLSENLAAYAKQDYPDYELIFVVSNPEDAAGPLAKGIPGARVLYVSSRSDEADKITKLQSAVRQVQARTEILAFADSDSRPVRTWLRELVAPLAGPEQEVGATTGYRWYLPDGGRAASLVRAAWNSFIASLLGNHRRNFCWGGSMALRRETFNRIQVDQYWKGSASDDYQLTKALNEHALPIRFIPACLVVNPTECGWGELIKWTTRQIVITRVYAPHLWKIGLVANGFYCAGFVALAWKTPSLMATPLLALIALTGAATGLTRALGAEAIIHNGQRKVRRHRWAFAIFAPFIPFLMLYNFAIAGVTRTISWRGTTYRLAGTQTTTVVRTEAAPRGQSTGV